MRRAGPPVISAALALAIAGSSGCGAIMMAPPREGRRPTEEPKCNDGRGGVVLDGLIATGLGLGGIAALGENEAGGALAALLVGGIFVGSALSGHRSASRCEVANNEFARELRALIGVSPEAVAGGTARSASEPDSAPEPETDTTPGPDSDPEPDLASESESESEPRAATKVVEPPAAARKRPGPAPTDQQRWSDFWQEVHP